MVGREEVRNSGAEMKNDEKRDEVKGEREERMRRGERKQTPDEGEVTEKGFRKKEA